MAPDILDTELLKIPPGNPKRYLVHRCQASAETEALY